MYASASRVSRFVLPIFFLLTLAVAPMGAWGQASEAGVATWDCLPEETALAVRIPNGRAIAEACMQNTKLGAVLFSEKRKQAVAESLRKSDSAEWSEFQEQLSEYGLTTDDLLQLVAGESGFAALLFDDEQDEARALALAWLEPGAELAARAYEILGRFIEEQEDDEHPITRVDLDLADHAVMQLTIPTISTVHSEKFERPDGYDEMSEEEQRTAWKEAYEAWQDSEVERVRYETVLVSTIGGRVLLATSFRHSKAADSHPDAERLAGIFARLLAEHQRGAGGFVAKYANDAGVARVMSLDGVAGFELVGDSAALMRLVPEIENTNRDKMLRMLGLKSLGPFALRSSLDGNRWQSQMSLADSRPLEGLMQWLDQPHIDSDPPAWAPAAAIAYTQYSFDLGKAYAILAEQIRREFPELSQQWLAMAEIQVNGVAEVGVEELLSSVGTRHTALNFETEVNLVDDLAAQQPESTAVVWQVTDEQIWNRVMQKLIPMVGAMPGAEFTDEQGYSGFRLNNEQIEGGLFLGNGNLVLAYGSQVLETTLSSLNNPPKGSGAFRGGKVYERANELLEPALSIAYSVVDGDRYATMVRDWFVAALDQYESVLALSGEDAEAAGGENAWLELARALLPSEKEVHDLLGVGASRCEFNDHGIFGVSVQELPPPDDR